MYNQYILIIFLTVVLLLQQSYINNITVSLPSRIYIYNLTRVSNAPRETTIDIVVARYKELDENKYLISRMKQATSNDTIVKCKTYNKYDSYGIVLPNVGRDPHTFLSHIVQYYDNLADLTFFVHGSFRSSTKLDKLNAVLNMIQRNGISDDSLYAVTDDELIHESGFVLSDWHSTHPGNYNASKDQQWTRATVHPFGEWVKQIAGININDQRYLKTTHGNIAVSRSLIQRRPLEEYERLRRVVAEGGPNAEVMHYMERILYALFQKP